MLHCNRCADDQSRLRCPSRKGFDMAKASKTADEKVNGTAENIETAMKNSTEALKNGFEKAVKTYDQFIGYGKESVEAYVTAATAAGKGAETIHNELYSYSKQSVEGSIAAAKALFGTKSPHEAFELQSGYAKTAFEAYVGELTKLSELFVSTAKEAFEPLQSRVQAWADVVQKSRAA